MNALRQLLAAEIRPGDTIIERDALLDVVRTERVGRGIGVYLLRQDGTPTTRSHASSQSVYLIREARAPEASGA